MSSIKYVIGVKKKRFHMASYPTPIDGHNRLPKTHRLAKRNEETLAEIASIIAKLPKNWKMYNLRDSVELRDLYLVRFYDECMIPNFPDKDELDPLEVWLEMFEPEYTHTVLHILVILNDNDQFAAGVVTEYYPRATVGCYLTSWFSLTSAAQRWASSARSHGHPSWWSISLPKRPISRS